MRADENSLDNLVVNTVALTLDDMKSGDYSENPNHYVNIWHNYINPSIDYVDASSVANETYNRIKTLTEKDLKNVSGEYFSHISRGAVDGVFGFVLNSVGAPLVGGMAFMLASYHLIRAVSFAKMMKQGYAIMRLNRDGLEDSVERVKDLVEFMIK